VYHSIQIQYDVALFAQIEAADLIQEIQRISVQNTIHLYLHRTVSSCDFFNPDQRHFKLTLILYLAGSFAQPRFLLDTFPAQSAEKTIDIAIAGNLQAVNKYATFTPK